MEIGTNELTRPFRIPRRKGGKNEDEKVNMKAAINESVQRSPLANASATRKNEASFSNRIVPPTKRKASQEIRTVTAKKPVVKEPSGGEVFDKIIGNMLNPPKEKKPETSKEREDLPGPSGTGSSKNLGGNIRRLTKEELDRQALDNSACYSFLRREGLMERLLGHKMLTGRVDSYVTLGYLPLEPGEQAFGRKSIYNCSTPFDDFPTICEPAPVAVIGEERRGPRTPPGSPGRQDNSSVVSSRGAGSATQSSHPPPPPPPLPPDEEQTRNDVKVKAEMDKDEKEAEATLSVMDQLDKCSHSQLAEFLVGELQNAMKQVDHKVLLSTLKDALMKVGKKNEDNAKASISIKKEEPSADASLNPPVEMDIESERSGGEEPVLPPPPPAPPSPTMINNLPGTLASTVSHVLPPCLLPTPPPPPPLVIQAAPPPPLILQSNGTQSALGQPTISAPILLPAPPAPIIPQSHLQHTVVAASNVHQSAQNSASVITTSISASLPTPFVCPPPVQRNVEQSMPTVTTLNADVAAPSSHLTGSNMQMSFTAPPPPVIMNTAVPPPNFGNTQSLNTRTASQPTSEALPPIRMQPNLPQLQSSVRPSTSSNGVNNVVFPPSKPPVASPLNKKSTEAESASQCPSLNPSRFDFTKPPPTAAGGPPLIPSTSATGSYPHSSVPPRTSVSSSGSAGMRFTSASSKKVHNVGFGKQFNTPTHSSDLPTRPGNVSQTSRLSKPKNNMFMQPSSQRNSNSGTALHVQQHPAIQTPVSSTPTSENVIKTLLNALAIPQKSQSVTINAPVQNPFGPSLTTTLRNSEGLKSSSSVSMPTNQKGSMAVNTMAGKLGVCQGKPQTPAVCKEKQSENQIARNEAAANQNKAHASTSKASESNSDGKFSSSTKDATLSEKPAKSFSNSGSKKNEHEKSSLPSPPAVLLHTRPRFAGPPGTHDRPLHPMPPGFIHPHLRPRFPPIPMPYRMRGPPPFPFRRPPPFPPFPPGYRMHRPRFNR